MKQMIWAAGAAIGLMSAGGACAQSPTMTGATFQSDWGEMTLDRWEGRAVAGRFAHQNGRFDGERQGMTVRGYWYQDESGVACPRPRNGQRYYGRMELTFAPDGQAFEGRWSYCDDAPSQRWNGSRNGAGGAGAPAVDMGASALGYIYSSSSGELTIREWADGRVSGVYGTAGRFDGVLTGDRLVGRWYQEGSNERCRDTQGGTRHHGRIDFQFAPDRTTFAGRWSYCDAPVTEEWTGTLTSGGGGQASIGGGHRQAGAPPAPGAPRAPGVAETAAERAARVAAEEAERRVHNRIREGVGRLF